MPGNCLNHCRLTRTDHELDAATLESCVREASCSANTPQAQGAVASAVDIAKSITSLFRSAYDTDRAAEGFELFQSAAPLRPSFGSAAEYSQSPHTRQDGRGDAELAVIAIERQLPQKPDSKDWQPSWERAHTVIDIPGRLEMIL
jgi:hypothetical protein